MYWPLGSPSIFVQNAWEEQELLVLNELQDGTQHSSGLIEAPETSAHQLSDHLETHPNHSTNNSFPKTAKDGSTAASARDDRPKGAPVLRSGILSIAASRNGQLLATVTHSTVTIWETKPTVILTSALRSPASIELYGTNVSVHIRPDAAVVVIHTSRGFLMTYSLTKEPGYRSYQLVFAEEERRNVRRRSAYGPKHLTKSADSQSVVPRMTLRFRMAVRFDADISAVLALEEELVVATVDPPAMQCISWVPDSTGPQTRTELFSHMSWLPQKGPLAVMMYDRPMNLYAWITADGGVFAVQRLVYAKDHQNAPALFHGHAFHSPNSKGEQAVRCAINARFSLVAVGCADSTVAVYTVRDYSGGIFLSHRLSPSTNFGSLTSLNYSPDGYCLFVGYEKGWSTWSVYGQQGGSSAATDRKASENNEDIWLDGVADSAWFGNGCELVFTIPGLEQVCVIGFARSAAATCFSSQNLSKALLQTSNSLMVYQGQNLSDITAISGDVSLWHSVQVPSSYLSQQWPIRASAISSDARYIGVAGQRGLAHYSVASGRWKTYENSNMENSFFVRGGMCWYQNILIAAVETIDGTYQVRLYSREQTLDDSKMLHCVNLTKPVVHLAASGDDSILIFTSENLLLHYVVVMQKKSVRLVKVGQIGLHGIIRAPSRVRAISWIVPDHQLQSGDPSQDVAVASVLFLIDGKLVLLQPATSESGGLKYDLRVIADQVEHFVVARDVVELPVALRRSQPADEGSSLSGDHALRDSLWLFDGQCIKLWPEVQSLLASFSPDLDIEIPQPVSMTTDFYPLAVLLDKAIVAGIEADLVQKAYPSLTFIRLATRTMLFLPSVLRQMLSIYDSPAASSLSHRYRQLPYFAHALEVLLHGVLDEEVDNPNPTEDSLLAKVLSFLSSFPEFLDIVVQCTRKTELRSWKTLFSHLPPPQEMFETSLSQGHLKTAGGYLLVLHTLDETKSTSSQVVRLLRAAKKANDWDLCKELARFLVALDESGNTLREALLLSAQPGDANGDHQQP